MAAAGRIPRVFWCSGAQIDDVGPDHRVIVLAFESEDSGVPASWTVAEDRPGVNLLPPGVDGILTEVRRQLDPLGRNGDIDVATIHWGGNWGHSVPKLQQVLTRTLVDDCGVRIVIGHSFQHRRALEMRKSGLILYGTDDLIKDYEGIEGHEAYRSDIVFG